MSSSGTVDSSAHQSGTSHLLAFHHTHLVGWDMGSSVIFLHSPPQSFRMVLARRKLHRPGVVVVPLQIPFCWRCIGRLASCRLATEAGLMLPFPAPVFRSQLSLHFCPGPERAFFLYNLSISSSRVATADKAFRCASHTLA